MRTASRVDSVPLLVNLHCGKPKRFDSSSATIATSATGCAKWEPRAMRLETASTISGWAWPTTMTPNPLWKSTYSLPSTSHTRLPRPYSTKIGWGEASWKDDGTPRGLKLRALRQSSSERRRAARNLSSSRAISDWTRAPSTSTAATLCAITGMVPGPIRGGFARLGNRQDVRVTAATTALNLTGKALTPGAQRSWWLREALAAEKDGLACPPLTGDIKADVVIVGGGFTGLWTAYHLTQTKPDLKVVVLEQDICGGGPSGRNGGFASGWWDELDGLITLYGEADAVRACRAISDSINAIGDFCSAHGVDAWFRHAGYLYAATSPQHEAVCEEVVKLAREIGAPEELRALTREEVKARCASPAFGSGAFMKDGASVQPAFLARGLRRVVMERGVTIHEGTPVTSLNAGPPAVAITPNGTVRAPRAVLAVNAWGVGWPQLRRRLVAWSSYIVLTAPAPEKVAEIGWTGGELITDFRTSVRYFRTT